MENMTILCQLKRLIRLTGLFVHAETLRGAENTEEYWI